MNANTTNTNRGVRTSVAVNDHQQKLAERITAGTTIGANAVAEVLAVLDGRCRDRQDGADVEIGAIAGIEEELLGRHSRRTLRRVVRQLLEHGLISRTWPIAARHPLYTVDAAQLAQRLADAGQQPAVPGAEGREAVRAARQVVGGGKQH